MNRTLSDLHNLAPMLYTPADRSDLGDVLSGRRGLGTCSIAVCLEDAVRPENRHATAVDLCRTLASLDCLPRSVFVRPADLAALEWLIENLPMKHIRGFILPKATVAKIHLWVERTAGTHTILPILESREALDSGGRRELAEACAAHPKIISAARIGANDLFSLIGGLRRPPGHTIYETPIGRVVDALIEEFSRVPTRLCGVVFDRINDSATFEREVQEDVYRGIYAKTVLNPNQSKRAWELYKPDEIEFDEATRLLLPNAPAVFSCNGHMLEPSCHTRWANELIDRYTLYSNADRDCLNFNCLDSKPVKGS
jgi:citrate lyase beta subunit